MSTKLSRFLLFLLSFTFIYFSLPFPAYAAPWTGDCVGTGVAADVATLKGLECAFSNVIGVVLGVAGIILFVMLLIGGFKYMTSGGDPKAVEGAKGTLTYAIAGLVILVLAYVVLLIIEAVTGVPVTKFNVTTP